jgi:hypothetical protein
MVYDSLTKNASPGVTLAATVRDGQKMAPEPDIENYC